MTTSVLQSPDGESRSAWELGKQTINDWTEDKAPRLGAALAYYAVFSIAPLLVIVLSLAGLVWGEDAVQGEVETQLTALLGNEGAEGVEEMVGKARQPKRGLLATAVGLAVLLFGASGVFGQLQDALNTIWEVEPKPGRGIMGFVRDRFFSFTMVLGTAFLLLVSLVVSAALSATGNWIQESWAIPAWALQVLSAVVSLAVVAALFALIFKFVPDAEIAWGDVAIGAFATAILFSVGKWALGLYLGQASFGTSYGAAGSLIVVLVWVYYSAQILFLGAEFTQAYARMYGSRIRPSKDAVAATADNREQQGLTAGK